MATQVQFRRGTTAQHSTFTGANAEITVDTDKEVAVVHDGSTAGGFPLARQDLNNVSSIPDSKLATISTAGKVSNSATTATSANTASAIVARDSSGNFSAGTITATTFSGSGSFLTSLPAGQLTGTVPSGVLGNSSLFVGTTSVALNRSSANQGLTGISSIALPGSTSGTVTVQPAATAGTTTITLPATTGTVITSGDSGTVTSTMLADGTIVNADINAAAAIDKTKISGTAITAADTGTITSTMIADGTIVNADINASAAIADTKLATISTAGKVSNSATTATNANTASAIVARDGSGNFSAGTITAALSGNATTATTLATARAIQGVNFDGSASITVVTAGTGISVSGTTVTNTGVTSVNGSTGAVSNIAAINAAQSFSAAQRGSITALTDGVTITPDFSAANNFSVTLGGNRTLANPTNQTAGQSGAIVITQDGTGSRTLSFGSNWKFPNGTAPTLTTTASKVDVLVYYVESASRISAQLLSNLGG